MAANPPPPAYTQPAYPQQPAAAGPPVHHVVQIGGPPVVIQAQQTQSYVPHIIFSCVTIWFCCGCFDFGLIAFILASKSTQWRWPPYCHSEHSVLCGPFCIY